MIWVFLYWSEPKVPVKALGHRRPVCGRVMAAVGVVDPHVHFVDFADGVTLDQFDDAPVVAASVNLRADLCYALERAGHLGDSPRFGYRTGERFLAVKVAATLEHGHGRDGVSVVGRGDDNGIQI